MCLDHPTVQELVGQIEDRRIITYGENPQADVRLVDVDLTGGISRFSVIIRDRKTGGQTQSTISCVPMPGHHNALNATAAITVAHQLGMSAGRDPQCAGRLWRRQAALHPHRRMERRHASSMITAIILSRSPPCCAPRAPRPRRHVIAIVQPHRYTRLIALFNEFADLLQRCRYGHRRRCLCGGRSADRRRRSRSSRRGDKAHGHRQALALQSPPSSPP